MFLLRLFASRGLIPGVVRKGSHLILLTIEEMSLRFLASNTFIEGDDEDLCKHFNLSYCKNFFPKSFLSLSNLQYVGSPPDFSYYLSSSDSNDEKLTAYRLICLKSWNLRKELVLHAVTQLQILATSMLMFLKESFEFQNLICIHNFVILCGVRCQMSIGHI